MKIIKKFIKFLVITVVLTLVGIIVYVQFSARNFIQAKLSQSLHQPIHLDHILYHFPFGFKAVNVNVGDFLTVKRMYCLLYTSRCV